MEKTAKIYVAGHQGMVGAAILKKLKEEGYTNFALRASRELDLRKQSDVEKFFCNEKPDYVVLAAARVGGILANMQSPAVFLYDNLMIQNNIIHSSYCNGVKKLLFLGSSCIYPRLSPQPMKEEYLMEGRVEPTNEGYAVAKIAGMKMCELYNQQYKTDYMSVMPCNLYGYGDHFDLNSSHVVPGLIRKFHEAKMNHYREVVVWGTGNARRELMYVGDMADACVYLMESYTGKGFLNVGTGVDVSISELAEIIKSIVGYTGEIKYDVSKPDGMPQKLLDVSKLKSAGWTYKTGLEEGISKTYRWYLDNYKYNGD